MIMLKIFLVDDDMPTAKILYYNLSQNRNNDVKIFNSGHDCLCNMHLKPEIITLDYNLCGESCVEIIDRIKQYDKEVYIIIISGQQDVATAVKLMKKGIYDYIVKDVHHKTALNNVVEEIRKKIIAERQDKSQN